jgi:hypothetical protein
MKVTIQIAPRKKVSFNNKTRFDLNANVGVRTLNSGGGANDVVTFVAGEQINSHTPVVLIDNVLRKMNNTNPAHQFSFIGFTTTSCNIGDTVDVNVFEITMPGWGLVPNSNYMAGDNGDIVLFNNGSGFTKIIGHAQNSNTLLIHRGYTPILK